jgi:tetratricopeptide (TPR) repeat protein
MASQHAVAVAWKYYRSGERNRAEHVARQLHRSEPDNAEIRFLLGVIAQSDHRSEEAADHFRAAIQLREDYAEARNNLGNALAAQGKLREAVASYRLALEKRAEYPEAQNNLGNALRQLGQLEEAQMALEKALELRSDYPEALNNLGLTARALGNHDDATKYFRRALMHRPDYPEASNNLGIVYALRKDYEEAISCFESACARNPKYVDACCNLGLALLEDGQFDRARQTFERALTLDPKLAAGHKHLGDCWRRKGDFDNAVQCYERAISLEPRFPEALIALGNELLKHSRPREALEHLDAAARLKPKSAQIHHDRGQALYSIGLVTEAEQAFSQALRCDPEHREAHVHLGEALLKLGEYDRGWAEHEWRLRATERQAASATPWEGQPLEGKMIHVKVEGSTSDAIQFARYLALLRERGADCIFECPPPMASIVERSQLGRPVAPGSPAVADYSIDLLSLPRAFGAKLDDLPGNFPYLIPDETRREAWRERLRELPGLRVGICWQTDGDSAPALPLVYFGLLAGLPGISLVAVANEPSSADRDWLRRHPQVNDFSELLSEPAAALEDVLALIANLDLIISADSTAIHLAGAVGIPAWVILPPACHWRWLRDRDDSPWYPGMQLFRPVPSQLPLQLFQRIAEELERRVASKNADNPPAPECWSRRYYEVGQGLAEIGRFPEAAACFRQSLLSGWADAELHHSLANTLRKIGKEESAIDHYETALQIQPDFPEALNNLGIALASRGQHQAALERFRRAVELNPEYAHAFSNLGVALMDCRQLQEAVEPLEKAVRLKPDFARAHNNLGLAFARMGNHQRAKECYQEAITLRPDDSEALHNLAIAQRELDEFEDAIESFERVLQLKPGFSEAYNNLGITFAKRENYDRAIELYRQALRLNPSYPDAHNNLGIALSKREDRAAAAASYREALRLRPEYSEAHNNLGIVLTELEEHEQAIEHFEEALRIRPGYAAAHSNLGIALAEQGETDLALLNYDEAVRLSPEYPEGHMNRALSLLQRERFVAGWEEYEWRWKCKDVRMPSFDQPLWDGSPLEGRTIVLHAEQGLGDTLQFIRYAKCVANSGGRVVAMVQKPLLGILARTPGIEQLVVKEKEAPHCDVHLPLMSLPRLFPEVHGSRAHADPYIFTDPALIEHWRRELSPIRELKIGVNWQGNPRYRGDRHRSIPLVHLAPLAHIQGIRLLSIQKNYGIDQLADLQRTVPITDLGSRLDEQTAPFMETAAVLLNLDLLITSDTAVAHLAGALGIPVWLAISRAADWRWLRQREDSPWYPSMRIFRQRKLGNWGDVFERIAESLKEFSNNHRRSGPIRVEVAAGELIDKITILEIKRDQLTDAAKIRNVETELAELTAARDWSLPGFPELTAATEELRRINQKLWNIEDDIRDCEGNQDFGERFIQLAREVYHTNDVRAELKKKINRLTGSRIVEEKSYASYSSSARAGVLSAH